MTTITASTPPLFDEARIAVAGYLARYPEGTRRSYASDLRQFFAWCDSAGLRAFEVRRPHLELWARAMEERASPPRRSVGGYRRWPASTPSP
jgi:integrase/recombinase XerD